MGKGGAVVRKIVLDGYIVSVGNKGNEITEEEYGAILEAIENKPTAPIGYTYKLKDTLEWELCEAEASTEEDTPTDDMATEADYQSALREMGVKV